MLDMEGDPICCDACPLIQLEYSLTGEKGQRILNAQDICAAIDTGFQVQWDSLPADEFAAATLIRLERNRLELEKQPKPT